MVPVRLNDLVAGDEAAAELEASTDELYGLDPADFVAARNDLVRRLRKEGKRELAKQVADLRRPSPAAWAVNQLARRHRSDLEGLFRLGGLLRTAQTRTLAGADAAVLRDAARARRDEVARLAETAVGLLAERGSGAATHQNEIVATLEAASLDPGPAAEVSSGRLSSGLAPPSGFGDLDAGAKPAAEIPASAAGEGEEPPATTADATDLDAEVARAERAVTDAGQRAADLAVNAEDAAALVDQRRRKVAEAEGEVTRLERELETAREGVEAARRAVEAAQQEAETARASAAAAAEQLREAERHAEDHRARSRSG